MSNIKIGVIGAGPAGITAAYQLTKAGYIVEVFEAGDSVGGMAKTIKLWGQLVDLGPHRFFSSDPRVNKVWLDVIGADYSMVNRLTRIYYNKKFFHYPLKPFNALFGLGFIKSALCIISYAKIKIFPLKDESTFDSWVTNRFGKKLYEIFFKSYSEKLWGISCNKLDADFASQRIKKLSLYEAIKSSVLPKFKNSFEHKTLVDQFAYSHKGAGQVYELMASKVLQAGGKINFHKKVLSVDTASGDDSSLKILTVDGDKFECDHVISSMPITSLMKTMNAPLAVKNATNKLKFRNTILVYLKLESGSPFPDQWIYIHSKELKTGRMTNFNNWVPSIINESKETIVCLEYWCYEEDQIWNSDDSSLILQATKELYDTNLVPNDSVIDGHIVRVPKCYPVYESGYQENLSLVREYLEKIKNLSVIGRYGSFKYNNQDHSILMGLLAADNIINNSSNNLWEVNSDYEYQESSSITASGLKIN